VSKGDLRSSGGVLQQPRSTGSSMPPTKAIEAGLKGARSGSRVLRLCTAPRELTPAQTPLRAAHLKAAAAHL